MRLIIILVLIGIAFFAVKKWVVYELEKVINKKESD